MVLYGIVLSRSVAKQKEKLEGERKERRREVEGGRGEEMPGEGQRGGSEALLSSFDLLDGAEPFQIKRGLGG